MNGTVFLIYVEQVTGVDCALETVLVAVGPEAPQEHVEYYVEIDGLSTERRKATVNTLDCCAVDRYKLHCAPLPGAVERDGGPLSHRAEARRGKTCA